MTDDEIKAKIKNMRYDTDRKRYIGDDGSELQITPYSNGRGYKVDYYESTTYGNAPHNSTHVQTDISGNWERTDNDRTNGTQTHSSGSGCYITSACMEHFQDEFDDNCHELTVLRWFRDNFVSDEDVELYYSLAPTIVENINSLEDNEEIYKYIYENVEACVKAIENKDYDFAYTRYKSIVLALNEQFGEKEKEQETGFVKKLGALHNKPALA